MSKRSHHKAADSLRLLRLEASLPPEDLELASLFGQAPPPLSEISAARIRRRLEIESNNETRSRRLPMWFAWVAGAAASLFLLEAAAAAAISAWPALQHRFWATVATHLPNSEKRRLATELMLPIAPLSGGAAPDATADAPAATPSHRIVDTVVPERAVQRLVPSSHRESAAHSDSATRPTSAAPEIALYTRALSQLNRQQDPNAALGTLNAYALQYPNGMFHRDAIVAQIRADLSLGRDAEVLGLLDALHDQAFAGLPQGRELGLLRVELLVRARRCNDALGAVGQYLEASASATERERALFSRASCRGQLKDFEGSREDCRDYLRQFPHGHLVPKILQTMNGLPEPTSFGSHPE